jgi:large subunit ribosomal protein L3
VLVVYTQPKLTGIGKKKPDLVEIGLGGADAKAKAEYAKGLLEKDIALRDVLKEGEFVDVHAVTKGKGVQGPVKRFGVKIRQHKSEKTKRGPGSLGDWCSQGKIMHRVAYAGKTGFNLRTENNKLTLKIGNKPEEINPKGGFVRYGQVKNDYILIKGSVPGAAKRAITLAAPLRQKPKSKPQQVEIVHTSLKSRQGL